ncbi:hypothetical protein A3C73_02910 [Candidatus Giovannonibacteria bacterium RIFCSPHIGHO2_02_FULL_44_11]|nr:MAG: hypothetical protein A3C73_02910 [Candidatus Giovannonibacteria bacterium RIFCSPHIGHO2_02_FULL_44_11]
MHKEILTKNQIALLPLIRRFSKKFGLVGGTAIALHIGHRRSIDFDLFTDKSFDNAAVRNSIVRLKKISKVLRDERGQYTTVINGVNLTFLYYPYPIKYSKRISRAIRMPDLQTLAAMKAFALGRRAKWKDYVDLFFIMKNYLTLNQIIKKTKRIFGNEFNEKNFRAQLAYFKDIDYSEKVIFMKGCHVKDAIIEKELIKFSME